MDRETPNACRWHHFGTGRLDRVGLRQIKVGNHHSAGAAHARGGLHRLFHDHQGMVRGEPEIGIQRGVRAIAAGLSADEGVARVMSSIKELAREGSEETEGYGVKKLPSGNLEIQLGAVVPFEVDPATAIKLACLLMKQAGMLVKMSPHSIIAFFRGGRSN